MSFLLHSHLVGNVALPLLSSLLAKSAIDANSTLTQSHPSTPKAISETLQSTTSTKPTNLLSPINTIGSTHSPWSSGSVPNYKSIKY